MNKIRLPEMSGQGFWSYMRRIQSLHAKKTLCVFDRSELSACRQMLLSTSQMTRFFYASLLIGIWYHFRSDLIWPVGPFYVLAFATVFILMVGIYFAGMPHLILVMSMTNNSSFFLEYKCRLYIQQIERTT
jgi:hypothetical protein